MLGGDLINRDARVNVGAAGLLAMHAGEVRGSGAGMVPRAVTECFGLFMIEPRKQGKVLSEWLERLQDAASLVVFACAHRRPLAHDCAGREVREDQPVRRFGGRWRRA